MTAARRGAARRRGRRWAALALVGCGLLLLASTQPWVRTLEQVAAGTPLRRGAVSGAELVPWLSPVGLVAAAAVVVGLTGARWARPLAVGAALSVLAGALVALGAASGAGGPAAPQMRDVVSSTRAPWAWVGLGAAAVTALATAAWWAASRGKRGGAVAGTPGRGRAPAGSADGATVLPQEDTDGFEAQRRRGAADWQELSEGRDPTEP